MEGQEDKDLWAVSLGADGDLIEAVIASSFRRLVDIVGLAEADAIMHRWVTSEQPRTWH